MAPADDALYLVFQRGHPHPDEWNDPFSYGARPPQSLQPLEHNQWREDRAQAMKDTGSPIVPDFPEGLRGADV
jgi:hypothetical protein